MKTSDGSLYCTWRTDRTSAGNPLLLLTDKSIPRIAIASPQHTAFGKIIVQALTAVRIYDVTVKRKLLIVARPPSC